MTMDLLARAQSEGLLDASGVAKARQRMQEKGEDPASALWSLKLLPERSVVRLLALETGYPGIELARSVIRADTVRMFERDLLKKKWILPVVGTEGSIIVAMANPDDRATADQLGFSTGRKILRHVAVPAALKAALEGALKAVDLSEPEWRGKEAWKLSPGPQGRASVVHPEESDASPTLPQANDSRPIVVGTELELTPSEDFVLTGLLDPSFDAPELPPREPAAPPAPVAKKVADAKTTVRVDGMGAGKIVLVVDDDPDMRALELKLLEPFGCALVQSGDGREGLALAQELKPSLVILDAMLPGMHGFEVCRAIKGDPSLSRTTVLMLSGVHTGWKIGVDVAEVYGADGFFEKPFRPDDFSRAIRRCLITGSSEGAAARARREAALATCREAAARSKAGKLKEAIALLRAATEKDPFSAEPQFYLGQALRLAHEPHQAIAAFERAAELRPDLEQPLAQLGDLYKALGFKKTALDIFRRAAELCQDTERRAQLEKQARELAA